MFSKTSRRDRRRMDMLKELNIDESNVFQDDPMFSCPLSKKFLVEPVYLREYNFEKKSLEEYFDKFGLIHPITKDKLPPGTDKRLKIDRDLQFDVARYRKKISRICNTILKKFLRLDVDRKKWFVANREIKIMVRIFDRAMNILPGDSRNDIERMNFVFYDKLLVLCHQDQKNEMLQKRDKALATYCGKLLGTKQYENALTVIKQAEGFKKNLDLLILYLKIQDKMEFFNMQDHNAVLKLLVKLLISLHKVYREELIPWLVKMGDEDHWAGSLNLLRETCEHFGILEEYTPHHHMLLLKDYFRSGDFETCYDKLIHPPKHFKVEEVMRQMEEFVLKFRSKTMFSHSTSICENLSALFEKKKMYNESRKILKIACTMNQDNIRLWKKYFSAENVCTEIRIRRECEEKMSEGVRVIENLYNKKYGILNKQIKDLENKMVLTLSYIEQLVGICEPSKALEILKHKILELAAGSDSMNNNPRIQPSKTFLQAMMPAPIPATPPRSVSSYSGFVPPTQQMPSPGSLGGMGMSMMMKQPPPKTGNTLKKKYEKSFDPNFRNCYIRNLRVDIDTEKLHNIFGKFGQIEDTTFFVHRQTGDYNGVAFCKFKTHEAAQLACNAMNNTEDYSQPGTKLIVIPAAKQYEQKSKYLDGGTNVYIKHLDPTVTDLQLRELFSPFGTITSSIVIIDEKTGMSKGFGFVNFSRPDEAAKAIQVMNGQMIKSRRVFVSFYQPKNRYHHQQMLMQQQQRGMFPNLRYSYPFMEPMPQVLGNGSGQKSMFGFPQSEPDLEMGSTTPKRYSTVVSPSQFSNLSSHTPKRFTTSPFNPMSTPPRYSTPTYFNNNFPKQTSPNTTPPNSGHPSIFTLRPTAPPFELPETIIKKIEQEKTYEEKKKPTQPTLSSSSSVSSSSGPSSLEDLSSLMNLSSEEQKAKIGSVLFPHILRECDSSFGKESSDGENRDPKKDAKEILKMFLEFDSSELLHLLETKDLLIEKVREAKTLISKPPNPPSIPSPSPQTTVEKEETVSSGEKQ